MTHPGTITVGLLALLSLGTAALRHPGDSNRVSSGAVAAELRGGEAAEARRRLRDDSAGTYIGELLRQRDSAVVRWPSGPPIRIWIRGDSPVADWSPDFADRARDAFAEWGSTGIPIRFLFVADSASADAQLTWVDHFTEPVNGRVINGLTRWGVDGGSRIVDASISIAIHRANGDPLSPAAVEAMTLHEVGHLLGLDHCTDELNIMSPMVHVRSLSDADRATVRLLYALPLGPLR